MESADAVPLTSPVSLCEFIDKFAVTVCVPSLSKHVVKPVEMSLSVLFAQLLAIVVPVTTGLPGVKRVKEPPL